MQPLEHCAILAVVLHTYISHMLSSLSTQGAYAKLPKLPKLCLIPVCILRTKYGEEMSQLTLIEVYEAPTWDQVLY